MSLHVTKEEVESLRYLKDAKRAAAYLCIPVVQVEDVWAEMPDPSERNVELKTERERLTKASERLKSELLQSMLKWARHNGTTLQGAGQFLLQGQRV